MNDAFYKQQLNFYKTFYDIHCALIEMNNGVLQRLKKNENELKHIQKYKSTHYQQ